MIAKAPKEEKNEIITDLQMAVLYIDAIRGQIAEAKCLLEDLEEIKKLKTVWKNKLLILRAFPEILEHNLKKEMLTTKEIEDNVSDLELYLKDIDELSIVLKKFKFPE